ncbi:hypothetical protein ACUL41_17740 [Virgibacillus natechei]
MVVVPQDIVKVNLNDSEITECIDIAKYIVNHVKDRGDLHERDFSERFINLFMGEMSEKMVTKWLHNNNKYAKSAVDKTSTNPDIGHDIWVKDRNEKFRTISVKSSLSVFKNEPNDILNTFKLASKESEIRDINIQVYFWLDAFGRLSTEKHRVNVLNHKYAGICGWLGSSDATSFTQYNGEKRQVLDKQLKDLRSPHTLLEYLK